MKKFLAALFLLTILAVPSFAKTSVQVIVDGELLETDIDAEIVEDRTFVPLRAIAEKLGAEVEWKQETQGIKLSRNAMETDLAIGSLSATVTKGEKVTAETLDAAPYIKDDRTFVPLRFIARGLGCNVYWCDEIKTAIIYQNHSAAKGNFQKLLDGFFNTDLPQAIKTDNQLLSESIQKDPESAAAYFANLWTERALKLAAESFTSEESQSYLALVGSPEEQYDYLVETASAHGIDIVCPVKICPIQNNGEYALVIDAPALRTADMATRMVLLSKDGSIQSIHF